MMILKIIGKILLVFVCGIGFIPLKILEVVVNLTRLFAGLLFKTIGVVLFLAAIGCYFFQLDSLQECVIMAASGAFCIVLPSIATTALAGVIFLEELLKMIMRKPIV